MQIHVKVLAHHIEQADAARLTGKMELASQCPIAQALNEQLPDWEWAVDGTYAQARVRSAHVRGMPFEIVENRMARLDKDAEAFVDAYDGHDPVEPFEFDLNLPDRQDLAG